MGGITFDPAKDVPDLAGKVIFITGGTSGLGKESILQIAPHNPTHIYFTGRNASSATSTIERVKTLAPNTGITFISMDQSSLASIKAAVTANFTHERLDVLLCNAGIMNRPPAQTTDGYELQLGTNHMGHALLIKLLLPTLLKTAELPGGDTRIIILTSQGMKMGSIDFKTLKTPQNRWVPGAQMLRYGQSKLANLLYAKQLSILYPQLTCLSIHPGVVKTELVAEQSFLHKVIIYGSQVGKLLEPEQGAYNQVWASVGDVKGVANGEYYEPVGRGGLDGGRAANVKLAKELWDWTQKELEAW
ncbi:NAD(P)-binding protein [Mytilinidion resinicola]|uniref:NAD(P)-binding protein n=1 Tax=Mytilinidion resinicola TaxID=574789 RepID=A0A6A6YR48_9PEZI|nr:NAD(P)-binding protein [Mytilinidion resinicola]KAF2811386.1 NAD(P)-binding protein [Mytilinidion resinicola]